MRYTHARPVWYLGWPVRSTLTYGKPYNKIFNGCEW